MPACWLDFISAFLAGSDEAKEEPRSLELKPGPGILYRAFVQKWTVHLYLRYPGLSVHLYLRYWRRQDRLAQAMTQIEGLRLANTLRMALSRRMDRSAII